MRGETRERQSKDPQIKDFKKILQFTTFKIRILMPFILIFFFFGNKPRAYSSLIRKSLTESPDMCALVCASTWSDRHRNPQTESPNANSSRVQF